MILIACLYLLRFIGSWFLFPIYLKYCCFHKSQLKNTSLQGLPGLVGRGGEDSKALSLTNSPPHWKKPPHQRKASDYSYLCCWGCLPHSLHFEDLCRKWKIVFLVTSFCELCATVFNTNHVYRGGSHNHLCYDPCCCVSVGRNIRACFQINFIYTVCTAGM